MRKINFGVKNANRYLGSRFSFWVLVGLSLVTAMRSLAHIFLPDGGASSIAGLDTSVAGGDNLIAIFGQWGYAQLLLSSVMWLIILGARSMVPVALLLQALDWGGRILIGQMKPVVVLDPPPGEIGSYVLFPICLIALWFAFPKRTAA